MNCPACNQPIEGGRPKRVCSMCLKGIRKTDKWQFNAHGQAQHKHCDDPRFQSAAAKLAVVNREMPLFESTPQ